MSLAQTQEFLSFGLGGLEYGLAVRQVRELCLFDSLERFALAHGGLPAASAIPGAARARGISLTE